ncbi:two component transcriptional regulator (plasmid) [Azospirillum sp. TSH58]|uniref:response regulator transcription factor n=1 Tax=Azospirillum sp. TSH58 TaxID=664962 RepID=UPI000D5FE2C1|nr:response regulator transcription factor [Azospirillum sp. TSH58]AWJ82479.1 two component transcriptional regulator [Azospirillum sp. TSH58]
MASSGKAVPSPCAAARGPEPVNGRGSIAALLLDETPLTRESLSAGLSLRDPSLQMRTAASVDEARTALAAGTPPTVVLCNLASLTPPNGSVLATLRDVARALGGTPLVILSDGEEADLPLEASRLGVRGCLPTSVGLVVAQEALRLVAGGGTFFPSPFLHRLQRREDMKDDPPMPSGGAALTARQRGVLQRLREGKSNRVIAQELGISENTTKVHVRGILRALGASNRAEAVRKVWQPAEPAAQEPFNRDWGRGRTRD